MLSSSNHEVKGLLMQMKIDLSSSLQTGLAEGLQDFGKQTADNLTFIREATTALASTLKRANTDLGKAVAGLAEKVTAVDQSVSAAAEATQKAIVPIATSARELSAAMGSCTSTIQTSTHGAAAALAGATNEITRALPGFAQELKREITLGLQGISITPTVPVTIDGGILTAATDPLRADLHLIGRTIGEIQNDLSRKTAGAAPISDEVVARVQETVQLGLATMDARLDRIQQDLRAMTERSSEQRPRWNFKWR